MKPVNGRGLLGRVFFLCAIVTTTLTLPVVMAHPEDELCYPGEPPTPFCLAMMGQLESDKPPSLLDTLKEYVGLGIVHIIPRGLDHIAFVLALFLAAPTWRSLLLQITTFTVAHSVTLALAVLGLTTVTGSWVEVLIAGSIVFVALENLLLAGKPVKLWRYAMVFSFGLLHGLGFADVLLGLGLPEGRLAVALLAFNVGVEIGQLLVVSAAVVLAWGLLRTWLGQPRYWRWFAMPASIAIAALGLFWVIERL